MYKQLIDAIHVAPSAVEKIEIVKDLFRTSFQYNKRYRQVHPSSVSSYEGCRFFRDSNRCMCTFAEATAYMLTAMGETGFGTMGVFDCGQDETHEVVVYTDGDQINWHSNRCTSTIHECEDVIDGITIPSIRNLSLNDLIFNLRFMKWSPFIRDALFRDIFSKRIWNTFKQSEDKKDNNKNESKLTIKVPIVSVGILKPHKHPLKRLFKLVTT